MLRAMTPPIKRKPTSRKPTSQRLRELREAQDPEPSQEDIAAIVEEGQMWVSRRERGKPEPTVDDAIRIAEALGYAADFLIVEHKHRQLLAALGAADPAATTLALRVLAAFPHLDEVSLFVFHSVLLKIEERLSEKTAG